MTSQLIVDPLERLDILKALASETRIRILELLTRKGPHNVNQVAAELDLPQSTVSANIQVLVDAGLVRTRSQKARKGSQKICHSNIFQRAFQQNQGGRAAAVAVTLFVIVVAVSVLQFQLLRLAGNRR
ncbi:MAG TPA: metalloregulator ArsR/SmtB family transcription factor [Amaricoccus sp.]|nr:metalloregulator ArsR/SmtB family transcription factor [Amaricoccus sp.]